MNATLSWRRTRNTSRPPAPGRTSTTVEAGRAGAGIDRLYPGGAVSARDHAKERQQMRRTTSFGVAMLCVSLSVACERPSQAVALTEIGCLTASGNSYVLTSLEPGDRPATELYQLVGDAAELQEHVGREVLVTGEADPARIAQVRETGPAAPVGTAGSSGDADAKVRTESQVRI